MQNQIESGMNVIACAFNLTPPGFDDTSPTPAKLQLDGVSVRLFLILKQASVGEAIKVTHCAYLGADYTTPFDTIERLQMKRVTLSAMSAEGELSFEQIATKAFPRRTYDLEAYPGLWNS